MQGMVSADSVVAPLVASLSDVFAALARVAIDLGPTLVHAANDLPKGSQLLLFCLSVKMLQQFAPQLAQLGSLRFIRDAYELTMKHFPWAKDIRL